MPNGGLTQWLGDKGLSGELQVSLLASIVALFVVWAIHAMVQRFLIARIKSPTARFSARRVVRYVAVFSAIFVVGRIWYAGFQSVATVVGLLGAGIAIALKDPLTNLAGWVFLVVRHPFRIGDRIRIGEHSGDVVDVGLFQFQLHELGAWVGAEQPTGRVVFIPNARVFVEPQINYHRGLPYIWDELPVLVTFESDWKQARHLLGEIGQRHGITDPNDDATPKSGAGETGYFLLGKQSGCEVYTSVKDSGVLLTLRYAVDARRRRDVSSKVWEDILDAFARAPDVEFAYPTERRIHLEPTTIVSADPVPRPGGSTTRDPS